MQDVKTWPDRMSELDMIRFQYGIAIFIQNLLSHRLIVQFTNVERSSSIRELVIVHR